MSRSADLLFEISVVAAISQITFTNTPKTVPTNSPFNTNGLGLFCFVLFLCFFLVFCLFVFLFVVVVVVVVLVFVFFFFGGGGRGGRGGCCFFRFCFCSFCSRIYSCNCFVNVAFGLTGIANTFNVNHLPRMKTAPHCNVLVSGSFLHISQWQLYKDSKSTFLVSSFMDVHKWARAVTLHPGLSVSPVICRHIWWE